MFTVSVKGQEQDLVTVAQENSTNQPAIASFKGLGNSCTGELHQPTGYSHLQRTW